MAKLAGWAVSELDKIVRQFRSDIEQQATKLAEDRGDAEANSEDVHEAVKVVIESRTRPAAK